VPESMTYSTLVSDITGYAQRTDDVFVAQIPRIIMLAQQRIPRELKILGFREEVTGNFDASAVDSGFMQKPNGWRKTISIFVGTGASNNTHTPVLERTYEYVRTVYPSVKVDAASDIPRFYADADYYHFLFGPAPYTTLPFKISYYSTLQFIDDTSETNWLTDNAPDLLLYACLLESVAYVKADERIATWQAMYDKAASALLKQEVMGLIDRQASTKEN